MLSDETPMESRLETGRGAEATFTAWTTDGLKMRGLVGGAVGDGEFVGKVLEMTRGPVTALDALYNVIGIEHAFTALVHVEQAGLQATVSGVITDGWGKGRRVSGEYTEIQCDHDGTTTLCWRGTLRIGGPAGN